jgi:hypothetical protein
MLESIFRLSMLHSQVLQKLYARRNAVAPGKTLDGQQRRKLLRRDAGSLRRHFGEMDESPKRFA